MSNVLTDIWSGITQGIQQKADAAVSRIQAKTGVQATSGNTAAYLGLSIVDAVSSALHGKADELTQQALNSGTGQKLVSQATQQKISQLIGDWRTWAVLIGFAVLFGMIGAGIRGKK